MELRNEHIYAFWVYFQRDFVGRHGTLTRTFLLKMIPHWCVCQEKPDSPFRAQCLFFSSLSFFTAANNIHEAPGYKS
jgi:hypothetical protein